MCDKNVSKAGNRGLCFEPVPDGFSLFLGTVVYRGDGNVFTRICVLSNLASVSQEFTQVCCSALQKVGKVTTKGPFLEGMVVRGPGPL